jgi:hypothetical protein
MGVVRPPSRAKTFFFFFFTIFSLKAIGVAKPPPASPLAKMGVVILPKGMAQPPIFSFSFFKVFNIFLF